TRARARTDKIHGSDCREMPSGLSLPWLCRQLLTRVPKASAYRGPAGQEVFSDISRSIRRSMLAESPLWFFWQVIQHSKHPLALQRTSRYHCTHWSSIGRNRPDSVGVICPLLRVRVM